MADVERAVLHATLDVPVVEASDVAVRRADGLTRVLVVGDRTAVVATADYSVGEGFGEWSTLDLAALPGWPLGDGEPSQFEAAAGDGGSLVALLREDPPVVLVADTATRAIRATITLVAPPWSALAGAWDDPSSRGEGMVLLRGGRLLVAKEKRPRALVEFGPPGSTPRGLSRAELLEPGESWQAPRGDVTYHALAVWKLRADAKKALKDISGASVGPDGSLWLVSDKSRTVARLTLELGLPAAGGSIEQLDEVVALPASASKAEGIAAVEVGRALVVLDTRSTQGNGLIVGRPERRGEGD
jgi:hypothetical protein